MRRISVYLISRHILMLVFSGCVITIHAQNMNTPYSIYGLGDLDQKAYNRTSGMGHTGLALPSSYYVIDNNPASLTGLTRSFFVIDAAFAGKTVSYKGEPVNADNSNNKDFWIKRLSLSVRINNIWASGIGFGQFSNVNYSLEGTKSVEGTTSTYLTSFQGDGGLNEYYWTNSLKLGRLSLGLKSSIIAGSINQTETVSDALLESPVSATIQDYYAKPRFQAGAIYAQPLNKQWDLSIGTKFIPKVNMISERSLSISQGESSLISKEFISNGRFGLPTSFGGGLALKHNLRTIFAADYTFEDWSSLHLKGQGWQMISNHKLSAGMEFAKTANIYNQLVEKRYYQIGAFMNTGYLQVRNQPIREFGFTAGMGGVLGKGLIYSLALEAGQRGTTQQNLIKENYAQLTFTFSYRDFLMSKGRKFD